MLGFGKYIGKYIIRKKFIQYLLRFIVLNNVSGYGQSNLIHTVGNLSAGTSKVHASVSHISPSLVWSVQPFPIRGVLVLVKIPLPLIHPHVDAGVIRKDQLRRLSF